MALPYRKILCPLDFDENSIAALENAAELARHHDATLYVLHTVPMIVMPTSMPLYVDIYKGQEDTARKKDLVEAWMTSNPVTGLLDEKLSTVHARMVEGGFRSVPLLQDGKVVALLTESDIRAHAGRLDETPASKAVTQATRDDQARDHYSRSCASDARAKNRRSASRRRRPPGRYYHYHRPARGDHQRRLNRGCYPRRDHFNVRNTSACARLAKC